MRRLVRHGLAGLGATAFAVVAAVTTLGAPGTTSVASPPVAGPPSAGGATGDFVPVQFVPADPVADAQAWREYLDVVVRERPGWGAFYEACQDGA